MKGILLAGGSGTRLNPITKSISKQMIPIYDKPMIYYPLSVLLLSGIRDILIISDPRDIGLFKLLFNDGNELGLNINYAVQDIPRGIADAFILGEEFIGTDNVMLVLGDNVFYGYGFMEKLKSAAKLTEGATIFGYHVNNPSDFGVVEFDEDFNILSIEEKPLTPKSNYAVPGLYFYDNNVIEVVKGLVPSKRGELEITEVNKAYLKRNRLRLELMERGMMWLDTGTPSSLLEASTFVEMIQKRQRINVGCIEEIAYKNGFIDTNQFESIVNSMHDNDYKRYLLDLKRSAGVLTQ